MGEGNEKNGGAEALGAEELREDTFLGEALEDF